jgi:3-oxoacyl-[acyl-carrier protein] reductase
MIDLSGRVLVVTGGGGAIGAAIARTFHACGANCVLTDLDAASALTAAQAFDPDGARTLALTQDVTRPEHATAACDAARERFGRVDFVVPNAGYYQDRLVAEMSDEDWRRTMAINLDGLFHTCRAAIPHLADGGAIVAIASMAGHRGSRAHAHYAAAKGAALAFMRSLALELAPRIRVNALSPGLIDTPLAKPLLDARGPALIAQTPLGRLGHPDEVARAAAFLCSDWASFITGETIHVNGGLHIAS